jgi:predicted DNA-binding transcriptional regulator AlpA
MPDEPLVYLSAAQICKRYGVSDMTLWRWLHDPELGFPQPALRVKTHRLWIPAQVDEWDAARAARDDPPQKRPASRCERDAGKNEIPTCEIGDLNGDRI